MAARPVAASQADRSRTAGLRPPRHARSASPGELDGAVTSAATSGFALAEPMPCASAAALAYGARIGMQPRDPSPRCGYSNIGNPSVERIPGRGPARRLWLARPRRPNVPPWNRQEELAVGRRLIGHIDGRTTDLADALFRNRTVNYSCRERAALERERLFRDAADLHGPVDAAAQARRLPHRGRGRHAGADDARRRRAGAGVRQHLPPSRRAGRVGLRQCPRLHLPLSRLDLRFGRQAARHHRQGGLRRPRSRQRTGWCRCRRPRSTACSTSARSRAAGREAIDIDAGARPDRRRPRGARARRPIRFIRPTR